MKRLTKGIANYLSNSPRRKLLRSLPKNSICAEIGVWKGDFSAKIMSLAKPNRLYLIDPWLFQPEFSGRWYGGTVAKSQGDMDGIFESVRSRFKEDDRVQFRRDVSVNVLNGFPDEYFDWVYIDGNHYFEYVLKDIELSLAKTKKEGIVCGDDLFWGKDIGFPVKKAVEEVKAKHKKIRVEYIKNQYVIYKFI